MGALGRTGFGVQRAPIRTGYGAQRAIGRTGFGVAGGGPAGPLEVNLGIALGDVPATDISVTLTDDSLTDTPIAALTFGGKGVTSSVQAAGWQLSEGMATDTFEGSVTSMIIDNVTTREADRRIDSDSVLMSNPITEDNKLSHNSFVPGGQILDMENADGNITKIMSTFLSGAGILAAEVLTLTFSATKDVETEYDFAEAEDYNFFVFMSAFVVDGGGSAANASSSIGMASFQGNALRQYGSIMRGERDGFTGSNPVHGMRFNGVMGGFKTNPQTDFLYLLEVTDIGNGTISLTPRFGNVTNHTFKILAYKIDPRIHWRLMGADMPTSTGTWNFDQVGFELKGLLAVCSQINSWGTGDTGKGDETAAMRGIVAWNTGGKEATFSYGNDEDPPGNSECFNVWYNRVFCVPFPDGTISSGAFAGNGFLVDSGDTIVPHSNGFNVPMEGVNDAGGARKWFGLYIGGRNDTEDLTTSLVRYYRLDENEGATVAIDASTNNIDGTLSGPAPGALIGKVFWGYFFDGVNDVVTCAGTGMSSVNAFTYCAWIQTTSTKAVAPIYQRGGNAILQIKAGTQIELVDDDDSSSVLSDAALTISDGVFHHIAVVKAGDGSNEVTFFLDGVAVGTATSSVVTGTGSAVKIGADSSANFYSSMLDEVMDFERALTVDQLNALPGF